MYGPVESPNNLNAQHVGIHHLHDDASINYQLNRWVAWTGGDALPDIRSIVGRLSDYATNRQLFLELAESALTEGDLRRAAFPVRAAEFFVRGDDPEKGPLRTRFVELLLRSRDMGYSNRDRVPFAAGWLPAYRFDALAPAKGAVLVFGGFDSYIEELFPIMDALRAHGWDAIGFEGPGQGGALEEAGLAFRVDWERPVAAVLDYYRLTDVTLLGISLGSGLAIRAAAYEPRVRRVVCDAVLFDAGDVTATVQGGSTETSASSRWDTRSVSTDRRHPLRRSPDGHHRPVVPPKWLVRPLPARYRVGNSDDTPAKNSRQMHEFYTPRNDTPRNATHRGTLGRTAQSDRAGNRRLGCLVGFLHPGDSKRHHKPGVRVVRGPDGQASGAGRHGRAEDLQVPGAHAG